jgi:hypothetical protein
MKIILTKLLLLIGVLLLVACSSGNPTIQTTPGYPSPYTGNLADPSYPAPTQVILDNSSYPAPPTPNQGSPVNIVPFRLNKPISAVATTVTGTGPAGVPILLVDITLNGEILAKTTIGSDGQFTFTIEKTLISGNLIGIALSDLHLTKWVQANFSNEGFFGDAAKLVPMVGFFYDTAQVIGG